MQPASLVNARSSTHILVTVGDVVSLFVGSVAEEGTVPGSVIVSHVEHELASAASLG